MKSPFYSIIIPVYNNEITDVQRCLDSIYRDILSDFEVLVMDDGSEMKCANALDILTESYPSLVIFHLSHCGAAQARNQGISYATGKYICFCDSDDYVTEQFLTDLEAYKNCKERYDVVYGLVIPGKNRSLIKKDSRALSLHPVYSKDYDELYRHMFDLGSNLFRWEIGYVSRGPVARIVKRELAEKISFNSKLVLGEDELWNLEFLEKTKNLAVVYHSWYI